ncbi:hypothetical protein [Endozoicomonas numazuensis]|uniref:Uncharacterized protein n=1 Tax=Endozoicomonas numazuensis TaxID=1137799 RepID=A0A081NKQ4_9GAMM|nr:hypothetical protein [Endozoicomonas numazuensis]KEQ19027.1 hypothetical protein GZ78_03065 [Endozoicomonas numazuensis]
MIKAYRKYRLTMDILVSLFLIGVAIAVVAMKYNPQGTIEFIAIDFLEPVLRLFASAPVIVSCSIAAVLTILACLKFVRACLDYKTDPFQSKPVAVASGLNAQKAG